MNKPFLAAIAFSLMLGACAASDTPAMDAGERISQRGREVGAYGEAWSHGQRDVTRGQRSIEKSTEALADGEKDLAQARAQVARAELQIRDARIARSDGEKLIQDGNGQMARAEADYTSLRSGPSAVTD
jgi:hypothetical protein